MGWLIVLVVVGIIIFYYATRKKVRITIKGSDTLAYEDKLVTLIFGFQDEEVLNNIKQIPFLIKNKTNRPITIDWDSSTFINPSSESCRIIHAGVKLTDRNAAQPPTIVASNSKLSDILIPSDNIHWVDGTQNTAGHWAEDPLLKPWSSSDEIEFKILLSLKIEDEMKHYEISFVAKTIKSS